MGAISQTFDTEAGFTYEALFYMAANPHTQLSNYEIKVTAANDDDTYTFSNIGKSVRDMGWEEKSFLFTATGSTTTLTFESLTNPLEPRAGPTLNNVRLELVNTS